MNEPLASITLIAAVLAFLWADGPPGGPRLDASPWRWALPGFLMGVTVMFRPEAIAFGVALAAIAGVRVYRARDYKFGLEAAGALLLAMVVALIPWTVRNAVTLHEVTPVGEGGSNALFIGTWLPGDGDHFKMFDRREELMDEYGVPESERGQLPPGYILSDVLRLVAAQAHPGLDQDKALSKLGASSSRTTSSTTPRSTRACSRRSSGTCGARAPRQRSAKAAPALRRLAAPAGRAARPDRLALLAVRRRWEAWPIGSVIVVATAIAVVTLAPPRRAVDCCRSFRHWPPTRRLPAGRLFALGADGLVGVPASAGGDRRVDDPVLVALIAPHHRCTSSSRGRCGSRPRSSSFVCVGVVVVLLGLDARVVDVLDLDLEAELLAGLLTSSASSDARTAR